MRLVRVTLDHRKGVTLDGRKLCARGAVGSVILVYYARAAAWWWPLHGVYWPITLTPGSRIAYRVIFISLGESLSITTPALLQNNYKLHAFTFSCISQVFMVLIHGTNGCVQLALSKPASSTFIRANDTVRTCRRFFFFWGGGCGQKPISENQKVCNYKFF